MSGAGPSLHSPELPSWSVFKFPPDPEPRAIPPPYDEYSFRNPFPISTELYNGALEPKVPLTIAAVYFVTVTLVNYYNRQHGNKAWAISKTRLFKGFVIFHNVFLAVYSATTCVAMVRALKHSIPHYTEHNAVVGTVDALCKIHGPRGLGDAATYNSTTSTWGNKNALMHLGDNGLPDATDVGRIWNEGLAFWGWFFYLSKFYEVLDTAIILAKGKRSTTLQKYHHAGAMLSMWAGMRYMSPPIWMFVLVNSGIHAMMYTYYTVSALGIRVPNAVKRSLTSMQILQFIVGSIYAALHLFVSYTVPVSTPYEQFVTSPLSSVSSVAASATNNEAVAVATGAAIAFLKKMVYRAAGEEGLAENIPGAGNFGYPGHYEPHQHQHQKPLEDRVKETLHRTEYQAVPCIDTSGQAFAIYLNLIYLAPLTGLFVRFFVKSYFRRTSAGTKHKTKRNSFSKATQDAAHGVNREIESLGRSADDAIVSGYEAVKGNANIKSVKKNAKAVKQNAQTLAENVRDATQKATENVRGRTSDANGKRAGSLSPQNKNIVDSIMRKVSKGLEDIGEGDGSTTERAKKVARDVSDNISSPKGPRSERGASPAVKDSKNSNDSKKSTDSKATNGEKSESASQGQPSGVRSKSTSGGASDEKSFADAVKEDGEAKGETENANGNKSKANGKGDESFMEVKKEDAEEDDVKDNNEADAVETLQGAPGEKSFGDMVKDEKPDINGS